MATKAPRKNKRISNHRRGPLSNLEKAQVQEWIKIKDDVEIARALRRPVIQITNYKKLFLSQAPEITVRATEAEEMRRELHAHSSWESIQYQFTNEELLFYENTYVEYRKQFSEMTATEFKQLEQLITIDIFMQRHNIGRMDAENDVDRLSKMLKREYANPNPTPEDKQAILLMETQIQASRAASVSRTKEYKDFLEKHQGILKDLKATREQRVKNLDQQGKFIMILKDLEIKERRKSVSEITGLMDLAVEKEKERLSEPFQYVDGMIDQAILNHETFKDEDASEVYTEN